MANPEGYKPTKAQVEGENRAVNSIKANISPLIFSMLRERATLDEGLPSAPTVVATAVDSPMEPPSPERILSEDAQNARAALTGAVRFLTRDTRVNDKDRTEQYLQALQDRGQDTTGTDAYGILALQLVVGELMPEDDLAQDLIKVFTSNQNLFNRDEEENLLGRIAAYAGNTTNPNFTPEWRGNWQRWVEDRRRLRAEKAALIQTPPNIDGGTTSAATVTTAIPAEPAVELVTAATAPAAEAAQASRENTIIIPHGTEGSQLLEFTLSALERSGQTEARVVIDPQTLAEFLQTSILKEFSGLEFLTDAKAKVTVENGVPILNATGKVGKRGGDVTFDLDFRNGSGGLIIERKKNDIKKSWGASLFGGDVEGKLSNLNQLLKEQTDRKIEPWETIKYEIVDGKVALVCRRKNPLPTSTSDEIRTEPGDEPNPQMLEDLGLPSGTSYNNILDQAQATRDSN